MTASRFNFRAWDGNRMVYPGNPDLTHDRYKVLCIGKKTTGEPLIGILNPGIATIDPVPDISIYEWFEQDLEFMQSTGLTDKDDVEIFENDLIQIFRNRKPHRVLWIEGSFRLVRKDGWLFINECGVDGSTVIGNVFENKELMT